MNFLAHCALADLAADNSDALIAGGVLADFQKGSVPNHWPVDLQLGVRLHRRIDAVSNRLPGIRQSCARFPDAIRRYAPIFVDVHADRCLSLAWANYHEEELEAFSARCYDILDACDPLSRELPARAGRFLSYMRQQDLLSNYADWRHIEQGVGAVCRRLGREQLAREVVTTLRQEDEALREDFVGYFPQLLQASVDFLDEQPTAAQ